MGIRLRSPPGSSTKTQPSLRALGTADEVESLARLLTHIANKGEIVVRDYV
ncbi:MAG: hypothetical protein ACE5G2_09770 [Candidatus Krumholzibacteriia bacterium]